MHTIAPACITDKPTNFYLEITLSHQRTDKPVATIAARRYGSVNTSCNFASRPIVLSCLSSLHLEVY